MAYGLEVRDSAGNVVVTLSNRLTKILGTVDVSASGSLTLPAAPAGNAYWCWFRPANVNFTGNPPFVRVSGGSLLWTYGAGTAQAGTIMYGAY